MRTSLTSGNCTRRLFRTSRPRSGRRHAIRFMAAALLLALPLAAHSQGTGQGTAPLAAPAAPGTTAVGAPATDTTQSAAAPSSAAAPVAAPAELPEDLSPWGMFENSDFVVKAVIIGLAFASLVTWTVWLAKTLELRSARGEVRRDLRVLNNS